MNVVKEYLDVLNPVLTLLESFTVHVSLDLNLIMITRLALV